MAWVRYDQGFPRHPKVRRAARLLGANGLGRVLAVHLEVTCYCNEHLTDGRIDNSIAKLMESDRDPIQVLRVFARSSIRLAIKVKGGFQLHDYQEYQPSKREVQEGRKKERDRKRKARLRPEVVPAGHQAESGVPIRTGTTDPIQTDQDQDPRADARAAQPNERMTVPDARRHLQAAVHALIESGEPYVDARGRPCDSELIAELKVIAARDLHVDCCLLYTSDAADE